MEQWAEVTWIEGYRGVLDVSSVGRVRRRSYKYAAFNRWGKLHTTTKPDKVLSPFIDTNGYPTIAAQISGRRKKFLVHRLVARAFVEGYAEGLTVNHINGIKTDNRADNLEWVTLAQNTQHQWRTGLVNLTGDLNPMRKLSSGEVRIIRRLLNKGATAGELATLSGVSVTTIYYIKDGRRWSSVT